MGRCCVFSFKLKTAYEMRISDWSSDVCSSELVGDDEVVGEDRDATAGDRLLPADEGEAGHRGWCGDAAGPYRQAARLDAVEVAQHAVGHQGGDAALAHARAADVAEDPRLLHAQGLDHGAAHLRPVLHGPARPGDVPTLRMGN